MRDALPSEKMTVQKIQESWSILRTKFSPLQVEALRNYRYVIGDQIDPEVKKMLREEHRPAMIFNLIQPIVLYMAGTLSSNKQAMKASPIRFGDELLAELHSVLVSDYAMEGCDGYEEIVKASIDAVIAKVGWLNNHWSTRETAEGKWITSSFDPLMIMWDPDARQEDQSDWRYLAVSAMYAAEEIIAIHQEDIDPEMKDYIRREASRMEGAYRKIGTPIGWLDRVFSAVREVWDSLRGAEHLRDEKAGLISEFFDGRSGLYRVIEWHEKRTIVKKWIYSPMTRQQIPIPEDLYDNPEAIAQLVAKVPEGRVKDIQQEQLWIVVVCPTLLPDRVILEKPYTVQNKGFQHKPIFCYSFHPDLVQTASVVDALIGIQDSFNQRRMTMLEYIMDTVNPRIEAPVESIEPEDMDAWKSKERGVIRFFKPQGGLKPEPRTPTVDKAALQGFIEEDRDLVQKTAGVSPNSQGYKESNNEPASLYAQRVKQGEIMMSFLNSHILRTMRSVFRYCDASLQQFLTMPRMVRLLSEPPAGMPGVVPVKQGEQDAYWLRVNWPTIDKVMNDVTEGEYDFKADFTQLGETARQIKFAEAMGFIKSIPPQLVKWGELFKLWDSPVAEAMGAFADQQQGAEVQAQQQQLKAQQDAQELQKAHGEASLVATAGQAQQQLDPVQQATERTAA
jgi:hypothetical protein